jgi:ribosomal peptide maturation radical SAM protein 1
VRVQPNALPGRSSQTTPDTPASVWLIAMPWQPLHAPSIQLGTLQAILERAGVRPVVQSAWLDFMEHCLAETAHRPEPERIGLSDYTMVTTYSVGFGNWIFAVPPFRDSPDADDAYLAYVRRIGVPERDIAKVCRMRSLVPAFLDRLAGEIVAAAPAIVGFTSAFSQNVPSLVLAKLLKQRDPAITIVFGGANCEGPMGAALHDAFPWIDVVVRGEAERVLPEVVRDRLARQPLRPQPGLCYRDGQRSVVVDQAELAPVPMDDVPTPVFDEYFERLGKTSFSTAVATEVELPYEGARGCWWGAKSHCTFCSFNGTQMAFRSKSPGRVVEDLLGLARRYGRLDLQVVDSLMDPRYFSEILPQLRDGGYDLNLFCETRPTVTREQVRLMREAGLQRLMSGIESLSTPILRLMRKGVTAFQNIRLLKWCAEYGVELCWNLIYGLPGEPPDEYARMADVVQSLTHLAPPTLCPLLLTRFSPYHENPAAFGLELIGPLPWYGLVYPADPTRLADLAMYFQYRHADGRDPEQYVAPLRREIDGWRAGRGPGFRSLRYRRGPGFLVVQDRRPNREPADYSFGEREASLYLACEDGATPIEAARAVLAAGGGAVTAAEAREYLDALVGLRLMYGEAGRYLALALPDALREEFCPR